MENKTQTHTPGPWRMGKRAYDRAIYGQQGAEVASMLDLFHTPAESLANARLIAAAPDLLESLIYIEAVCKAKAGAKNAAVDMADLREFASIARLAIARAEGGVA